LIAKILFIIGSLPFLVLGTIHLLYTFFTDKFSSRNEKLVEDMKSSYPRLTRQTTMWNAWIGFNASHSSGAMFIGALNLYLGLFHFDLIQQSFFLLPFTVITTGFYLWLAHKYWFQIPFVGILLACTCYLISFLLVILT
jgi:hypothetical protein